MRLSRLALPALALAALPTLAAAQDPNRTAILARQGQMELLQLHGGVLFGMARGNIDYDAELASLAAGNILAVTTLDQSLLWPEGSGVGEATEETRALPAIWEDNATFMGHWSDLGLAAEALAEAAGGGLESMQAAIGPLGQSCSGCHESFRQSN
ncbi:cytochrome c [Rhodobacterales bacterium HKCCE2091]|nr:cytochrome c [Rhodobacterales bacterium HKCCE2091]